MLKRSQIGKIDRKGSYAMYISKLGTAVYTCKIKTFSKFLM